MSKTCSIKNGDISDGYHTFDELEDLKMEYRRQGWEARRQWQDLPDKELEKLFNRQDWSEFEGRDDDR